MAKSQRSLFAVFAAVHAGQTFLPNQSEDAFPSTAPEILVPWSSQEQKWEALFCLLSWDSSEGFAH